MVVCSRGGTPPAKRAGLVSPEIGPRRVSAAGVPRLHECDGDVAVADAPLARELKSLSSEARRVLSSAACSTGIRSSQPQITAPLPTPTCPRSQAPLGSDHAEALPRRPTPHRLGGAELRRWAFPSGAWERGHHSLGRSLATPSPRRRCLARVGSAQAPSASREQPSVVQHREILASWLVGGATTAGIGVASLRRGSHPGQILKGVGRDPVRS